jgi:L-asparaginase
VDSSDIQPEHWTTLAEQIHAQYDDYDGFIITHGTNTMGYTCAALSFAFQNLKKPVVVTGSQIPYGWPGSDALMNLENSLRVVTWPYNDFYGVLCVFGSHIIAGTRAKKATEFDLDAFQSFSSANLGRIGRIISIDESNCAEFNKYASRSNSLNRNFTEARNKDDLIVSSQFDTSILSLTEFPGMSPELFMDILTRGIEEGASGKKRIRGVVFRAFGAGDVSTQLHPCFEYMAQHGIPAVVTTQAPNGTATFTVNTPGKTLGRHGWAIPAHNMSIEAITTKLAWLLAQELAYDDIVRIMLEDLHGEVTVAPDRT